MRVSYKRDLGDFFQKNSKKNSPVFWWVTYEGDFLKATFFFSIFEKKKVALKNLQKKKKKKMKKKIKKIEVS